MFVRCCQLRLPTWEMQQLVGVVIGLMHLWGTQGLLGTSWAVGVCRLVPDPHLQEYRVEGRGGTELNETFGFSFP
jgi:hypothetical protein